METQVRRKQVIHPHFRHFLRYDSEYGYTAVVQNVERPSFSLFPSDPKVGRAQRFFKLVFPLV